MSIRLKIILGFALLIAVLVGQGVYLLRTEGEMARSATMVYEGPMMANHYAHLASADFIEADRHIGTVLMMNGAVDWEAARNRFREVTASTGDNLGIVIERAGTSETRALARKLAADVAIWRDLAGAGIGLNGTGAAVALPTGKRLSDASSSVHAQLDVLLEQIAADGYAVTRATQEKADAEVRAGYWFVGAVAAAAALFGTILAFGISRGLRGAVAVADRIAAGDLDKPVQVRGRDE